MDKQEILKHLREQQHWTALHEDSEWLGIFHFGSYNYDIADEYSDIDSRYIVFNNTPLKELRYPTGEHIEVINFDDFIGGLLAGQLTLLETLDTDLFFVNPNFLEEWKTMRSLVKEMMAALEPKLFNSLRSSAKMNIERFNNNESEDPLSLRMGYPPKILSHMRRNVIYTNRLLNHEYKDFFKVPLAKQQEHLFLKRGGVKTISEARKILLSDYKEIMTKTVFSHSNPPSYPQDFFKAILSIESKLK